MRHTSLVRHYLVMCPDTSACEVWLSALLSYIVFGIHSLHDTPHKVVIVTDWCLCVMVPSLCMIMTYMCCCFRK